MRVTLPGVSRCAQPFSFSFDGADITAYPGESIAAALIAAGQWEMREARAGARRGLFCGMGVCGECEVNVNGRPRRACLEPARAGLVVNHSPQRAAVPMAVDAPTGMKQWEEVLTDVLVVGAGPAGLAAARAAACTGVSVLVVDEREKAGGQYFKQPGEGMNVDEHALDAQFAEGRVLSREASAAGARFLFGATVWGAFPPDRIALAAGGLTRLVRARRIVLATGAYERVAPFPGWTLPGVLTSGAAQSLLRAHQVAPGQRVLIAGHGPLNLQVASELSRAGVQVVAVAELAAPPHLSFGAIARMAVYSPSLTLAGMRHLAFLRKARVPIHYRHALVRASGTNRVASASLARIDGRGRVSTGGERTFEVDAICVNFGFLPQSELPRALGVHYRFDPETAAFHAIRGDNGRCAAGHIFVVGDAGGLGGARMAIAQGSLAGAAAASDLHAGAEQPADRARLRRTLERHRRFQAALWTLYRAPGLTIQLAEADTPICRCEEIDRATLERVVREDSAMLGSIKRATRAGMGRCQGRYCATLLAALARETAGRYPGADDFFAPRPPFKPVALATLAGSCGEPIAAVDILRTDGRDANIRLDQPNGQQAP